MDPPALRQYRRLLHESQRIEAVASAVYAALARKLRDPDLRSLMARLAADEALHARAVASLLRGHQWRDAFLLFALPLIGTGIGYYLSGRRTNVVLLTLIRFEDDGAKTYRCMLKLDSLTRNERNEIEIIAQTEEEHSVLLDTALRLRGEAIGR